MYQQQVRKTCLKKIVLFHTKILAVFGCNGSSINPKLIMFALSPIQQNDMLRRQVQQKYDQYPPPPTHQYTVSQKISKKGVIFLKIYSIVTGCPIWIGYILK